MYIVGRFPSGIKPQYIYKVTTATMSTRALIDVLKQTINSLPLQTKLQPTLPAKEVPRVLHEPAIEAGYRVPGEPWRYYFYSLFQLHNETVNVWSHLIGCCIILHKLYGYFDEFDLHEDTILSVLLMFGVTCLIGLFTSAMVHLLHGKSPYIHVVAFMVDYIGATFCSFGSGLMGIYGVSTEGFYNATEPWYLPLIIVASYANFINLCAAKVMYSHDPSNLNRKYMFLFGMGIQAIINMAPFVPRYFTCYYDDTCSMTSLNYLTAITIVFALEAIAFAAHQPEKTWPGMFDIVGHGHQIFHVLIVLNHVLQLDAMYADHVSGLNHHSAPNAVLIFGIMVVLYIVKVITLWYITRLVPGCLKKVEKSE